MFEATAKLEIREGELEAFKQQAAEVIRLMSEQGDKPLRYDWFLSDDGTECEVREAYESADALLAHQQLVAEAKLKLFRDSVAGHSMSFYDDLSPALAHALEAMATPYQRFTFLQGLETEDKAPEQVTA